MMCRVGR